MMELPNSETVDRLSECRTNCLGKLDKKLGCFYKLSFFLIQTNLKVHRYLFRMTQETVFKMKSHARYHGNRRPSDVTGGQREPFVSTVF